MLDFIHAVEQHAFPLDAVHSFMLLRHGKVAAEGWWAPYGPEAPHTMYSLSKCFTSAAMGLAVSEGMLTVDDPVLKFFPDIAPPDPGDNLRAMRVRHLLSMNTGHHEDTLGTVFWGEDDNWARAFLLQPLEHEPGTWFVYNTPATYMLSAIISRLTDEPLLDYLRPRLFDPLGIENPAWDTDPHGISLGGTGLHIRTEDIARFGQMYLQKGTWEGRRILPEAWISESTSLHSDNSNTQTSPDWTVGYGYQFWRCRHNCYRGDGAFGQFCTVMPEQDAVIAITAGARDMQAVLDKVWRHLLPAIQPEPLPANAGGFDELRARLAALSLPIPQGKRSSRDSEQWCGRTYNLESNDLKIESIAVTSAPEHNTLTLRDERGEHRLRVGFGSWMAGTTDIGGRAAEPAAACGAWTADDTYEARVCFCETPYCRTYRFRFAGEALYLEVEPNVSWDPPGPVALVGHQSRDPEPVRH